MASVEVAPMIEYPVTASPLRNELVTGIPTMMDGDVIVGDAPGLGISLDSKTLERYRI
jgi:L-alanine-DL-glutamate epimerase-like enolase superfamily enzyme